MVIAAIVFDQSVGGLFSPEYVDAPWDVAKLWDLLKHMWIPVLVVGTSGTAGLIRMMRGNLLDVLKIAYITSARAKGLPERRVIIVHAVRNAIHPLVMILGTSLPQIISGATIVSMVLSLPTTGPTLLQRTSPAGHVFGRHIPRLSSRAPGHRQLPCRYPSHLDRPPHPLYLTMATNAATIELQTGEEARETTAISPARLIGRRFLRNKLAIAGGVVLFLLYMSALFADFIAPIPYTDVYEDYVFVPPQLPRFLDEQGKFHLRPFVYGLESELDMDTFRFVYSEIHDAKYPIKFFVEGYEYKLLGLIPIQPAPLRCGRPRRLLSLGQ